MAGVVMSPTIVHAVVARCVLVSHPMSSLPTEGRGLVALAAIAKFGDHVRSVCVPVSLCLPMSTDSIGAVSDICIDSVVS